MIIEQHWEAAGKTEGDELRVELQCISKSAVAHKLMQEDPAIEKFIKRILLGASKDIIAMLKHEYDINFPQGVK